MAGALETLPAFLEFAQAIKKWWPNRKNDRDLQDSVTAALRDIYFWPDGILSLLKKLECGGKISQDELRSELLKFNDGEWEVRDALQKLSAEKLERELGLSIRSIRTLELVRMGKKQLRQEIQEEVNYYGQRGAKPDTRRIRTLVAAIAELNASIESIEGIVNKRPGVQHK